MAAAPSVQWIRGFGAPERLAAGGEDDATWSESHVAPEPMGSAPRIIPHKIVSRLKLGPLSNPSLERASGKALNDYTVQHQVHEPKAP